jgi:hypothetical protein
MFYCERCAIERDWPISLSHSYGPCEICGRRTHCNNVPSSVLPVPKEKKIEVGDKIGGWERTT